MPRSKNQKKTRIKNYMTIIYVYDNIIFLFKHLNHVTLHGKTF